MTHRLSILVQTPAHSQVAGPLSYRSELALPPGSLVRVPLGKRDLLGVVWEAPSGPDSGGPEPEKMRPITAALDGISPLSAAWRQLVSFAAGYYQRSLGEVALAALPPQLRDLQPEQLARRLKRQAQAGTRVVMPNTLAVIPNASAVIPQASVVIPNASVVIPDLIRDPWIADQVRNDSLGARNDNLGTRNDDLQARDDDRAVHHVNPVALTAEQTAVIDQFHSHPGPFLLFGAIGSGKTEVYLRCVQQLLERDPSAQALVMVPEINLTPQLEERFVARFGQDAVVSLHSGMTNPQRLKSWLAAHSGAARIVLGTRMAVFASLPRLQLIVVDEEHDPSYKQQEGARYSARDLAVYRGRLEGAKVLLGSATPSLESWHHSRPAAQGGRYRRLLMPSRVGAGSALPGSAGGLPNPASGLPLVRRVDMNHQPKKAVFSPPLLDAIKARVARGEQCMVFLNRRGYAPVLHCSDCDWKSECPHCSAFRVFHKIDRTLRCHHCGFTERVPRACPACGNPDIAPLGRGTERLEEQLAELLADVRRPNSVSAEYPEGEPIRIVRIDADSTRLKGTLESQLAQVHSGAIDVLVGTQMIAKGHDFRRITLVAAINADSALFSSDFRAPERLFSLLMQAAGRAGRDAGISEQSEMWVQTFHPAHPLFAALKQHDYPAFAKEQLKEREQAGLPPFSFQALVRAEARTQEVAQGFLNTASAAAAELAEAQHVTLYPAVPMSIQRIANIERAQMLVESPSRAALQRFLNAWHETLHATRQQPEGKGLIRWAVDVDPLTI